MYTYVGGHGNDVALYNSAPSPDCYRDSNRRDWWVVFRVCWSCSSVLYYGSFFLNLVREGKGPVHGWEVFSHNCWRLRTIQYVVVGNNLTCLQKNTGAIRKSRDWADVSRLCYSVWLDSYIPVPYEKPEAYKGVWWQGWIVTLYINYLNQHCTYMGSCCSDLGYNSQSFLTIYLITLVQHRDLASD